MLLWPYGGGKEEGCNITGDTKTIAAAVTSTGHRISVSLRREPSSSALSRICLCFLPGRGRGQSAYSTVIAAHGGSVLVKITSTEGYFKPYRSDYFFYSNAVAADPARPPSLYLLPRRTLANQWPWMDLNATGLLCCGEAEFVVAELKIVRSKDDVVAAAAPSPISFEMHIFRCGEWCVKRPLIIVDYHGKDRDLLDLDHWEPQAVAPLGDRLLCWVDHRWRGLRGVILSNVLDESPELHYVPYPAEAVGSLLCTSARGALKLVDLSPGRCHCGCSEHVTTVNTWALKTDDMAWVLETETMADSTNELGHLETWGDVGYARVHLVYPIVGCGDHIVPDESSGPSEDEDENTTGKETSHKGN